VNKIALTLGLFIIGTVVVWANWQGDLLKGGIDTFNGYIQVESFALDPTGIVDYTTTSTARTIKVKESGTAFTVSSSSDDPVTFNLPAAAAGLIYTFVDLDATAAADLTVDPATGDKINGGTAGVSYNCTGDAIGETMTLLCIDDTNWVIVGYRGTWATGS
jgi:hypothetical protein